MAELVDLAASVLNLANDGEHLEAYAVHTVTTTVEAGSGAAIRRVDRAETRGIGLRLFFDQRVGYASTGDVSAASLRASVARARANARASDPDPPNVPPEPQPSATPGWTRRSTLPERLEDRVVVVRQAVTAAESIDARVRAVDSGEYRDERREVAVVSTTGVRAQFERDWRELYVDVLGEHRAGQAMDCGYWCGSAGDDVDPEAVAREAVERTVRLLGEPLPRPPGVAVLLDYTVAGELLAAVGRACTGGAIGTGRSPFARLVGQPVGSAGVSLVDDGRPESVPGGTTYDDEGVPRRCTSLISAGVLIGALHSTATAVAMEDGSTSTGNARRATHKAAPRAAPAGLRIESTAASDQLAAKVGDAVYIQGLTGAGSGINSVTGRVDVGGVGWLLQNGAPAGPVATVPLATDLVSLLRTVTQVGDDTRPHPESPVVAGTVCCGPDLLG